MPKGFSNYSCFYTSHLQHYLVRCCSLDYFLTISFNDLGSAYIVSTPFINIAIEFSKPSPKNIFLHSRFLFIRAVLLLKFPLGHSLLKSLVSTYSTNSPTTIPPFRHLFLNYDAKIQINIELTKCFHIFFLYFI